VPTECWGPQWWVTPFGAWKTLRFTPSVWLAIVITNIEQQVLEEIGLEDGLERAENATLAEIKATIHLCITIAIKVNWLAQDLHPINMQLQWRAWRQWVDISEANLFATLNKVHEPELDSCKGWKNLIGSKVWMD
jgi:hypothetical protein